MPCIYFVHTLNLTFVEGFVEGVDDFLEASSGDLFAVGAN